MIPRRIHGLIFDSEKNHKLSINFRTSMDFMYSYANEMQNYIRKNCDGILYELIEKKKEYEDMPDDNDDDKMFKLDFETEIINIELELSDSAGDYCQVLFMSVFISIYALFEKYLDDLCKDICNSENLALTPNKLKEKGIKRSQIYLKKVAGLCFPDNKQEWSIILGLSDLRNKFVHNAGIDYYRKDVNENLHNFFWIYDEYLKNLDGYAAVEFEPMLSFKSIIKVIDTLKRFSIYMDDTLRDRYEKRERFKKGHSNKI